MAMTAEERKRRREKLDKMAEEVDWSDFFSDVPSKRKRSEKELAELVREEYKRGIPLPEWYIEKYSIIPPETLSRWVSWWKKPRARYPWVGIVMLMLGVLELLTLGIGIGAPFLVYGGILIFLDLADLWEKRKTKRK